MWLSDSKLQQCCATLPSLVYSKLQRPARDKRASTTILLTLSANDWEWKAMEIA